MTERPTTKSSVRARRALSVANRLSLTVERDAEDEDAVARIVVHTAYYGVFHAICSMLAERIAGPEPIDVTDDHVWTRAYRTLDHSGLRSACNRIDKSATVDAVAGALASSIVFLQSQRLAADYSPARRFRVDDAETALDEASFCLFQLNDMADDARRACLAELLVRPKERPNI